MHRDLDTVKPHTEGGLRQRKKQATRETIVAAATTLFLTKGIKETTIADLATEANIAPRTFFLHFTTKEDVLFHHVEEYTDIALDVIGNLEPDATAWDGIQRAVTALITLFDDASRNTDSLAPFRARIIQEGNQLPPSLFLRLATFQQQVRTRLGVLFPETPGALIAAHLGSAIGAVSAAATYLLIDETTNETSRVEDTMRLALDRAGEGFCGYTDN